jgi:hypothetical protein
MCGLKIALKLGALRYQKMQSPLFAMANGPHPSYCGFRPSTAGSGRVNKEVQILIIWRSRWREIGSDLRLFEHPG